MDATNTWKLFWTSMAGMAALALGMTALVFLSAGTIHFWQGWVLIVVFVGASLVITLDLLRSDPALLARRLRAGPTAERETSQQIIQGVAQLTFAALLVVPGLDCRFGWSQVPAALVVAGDVLVALGFVVVAWVFKSNSFTSATIEVGEGQQVVSSGPYGIVRHPMYVGGLVLLLGMPLALASWWALLILPPIYGAIVWRLLDEERFLSANLEGYDAYRAKVRYRLAPLIW